MYERISIQGFRGLKELTIDRLAPINILIGKNGSGKSTVLEALWIHANPAELLFSQVDAFRIFEWDAGEPGRLPAPWQHLFYGYELPEPIAIAGRVDNHSWTVKLQQATEVTPLPPEIQSSGVEERMLPINVGLPKYLHYEVEDERGKLAGMRLALTVEGRLKPFNPFTPWFGPSIRAELLTSPSLVLPEMAVRFGRIDIKNKRDSVINVGRILEPNLKRLASVPRRDGKAYLYADIGQKELLPVQLIGGGFVSVLGIAIVAVDMESGLLLVDEIENGIHYSALQDLWKGLWGLHTETGVQIVATTHSLECFEAARKALPPEALLVHRLERDAQSGKVRVGSLDAEALEGAASIGLEVR